MKVFRIAFQFFKTWFLPLPAHDDMKESIANEESEENIKEEPAVEEIEPPEVTTAQMPRPADFDPENKDLDAVNFSHLVKAPEGSEERLSRKRSPEPAGHDEDNSQESSEAASGL